MYCNEFYCSGDISEDGCYFGLDLICIAFLFSRKSNIYTVTCYTLCIFNKLSKALLLTSQMHEYLDAVFFIFIFEVTVESLDPLLH